ncbi:hypothetical protein FHR90_002599 [Endobacter medicaginis]|uniref:YgjP-like metallopeptidase domain-containing protein n=2 Tax=Endobacter medicaginis TaxID=1181271 RepID=A0A839V1Z3_9PROT|nr:hypothetical protein [Endobacter medicaginis]MCX5475813.1 SprT family zinc-dependent metalloprotease [Endobacter medicaginis]
MSRPPATPLRRDADDAVEVIELGCGPVPVRWRVSRRARRLSLRIDPSGGHVVVTLPPRASRSTGRALLGRHSDWIAGRLAALPSRIDFADGVCIPLDGLTHRIRHDPLSRGGVRVDAGMLVVSGEAQFLPRRLSDFLRAEARRRLAVHVGRIGAGLERRPRRLSIKDVRSRWGSCTADGTLMLSWRLVMAPPTVQDYVVAHEMAHLSHMDHGEAFWRLVDRLTPNRLMAERWLREQGPALLRIG